MSEPRQLTVMISADEIAAKVKALGQAINARYQDSDKELILIRL